SVWYSGCAWARTPLTTTSSTPASRSHSAARRAWRSMSSAVWSWSRSWNRPVSAHVSSSSPKWRPRRRMTPSTLTRCRYVMSLSTLCLANDRASTMSTLPPVRDRLRDLVGNAGEDHPLLEQEHALEVQGPLPVQELVPPARDHDLRDDHGGHRVLACGDTPYFLLYRDPQIAERRLHDVELQRDVLFLPRPGDGLHLAGVQRHEQRPRLRAPQRASVVDRLDRPVVHRGDQHDGLGALRDEGPRVLEGGVGVPNDRNVGHHQLRDRQQAQLQEEVRAAAPERRKQP